jgi:ATP adenylyltransferase
MKPQAVMFGNAKPCIFCPKSTNNPKSVLEKQTVYKGLKFSVLLDTKPLSNGHVLVIPNDAIALEKELKQKDCVERDKTIRLVEKVFIELFKTDNYFEMRKNGKHAGQSVDTHLHYHMIPIRANKWGMLDQTKIIANTMKKMFCSCCAREMNKATLAAQMKAFSAAFERVVKSEAEAKA